MVGKDGRNAYTFDEKLVVLMQSVRKDDFEDKKEAEFC